MKASKISMAIGIGTFMLMAPLADAQRSSAGAFAGNWKGTLTMGTILDVPPEHLERLSKPVELEVRIESRQGAEIVFTSDEDEWKFTEYRNFRLTPIGERNGVIEARIPGNVGWFSSITLNMTVQGDGQLLLSWSRLTTRDNFLYDGLDEYGFAGVATLTRIAD